MPGLVPGIHVFTALVTETKTWMAGTSPAMTQSRVHMTHAGVQPSRICVGEAPNRRRKQRLK